MICENCLGQCNAKGIQNNKLPVITGGFINVTQRCNMRCAYCFVEQQPKDINLQTAKDAVDFFARNAEQVGDIPSINYFGGEPLIRWNDIIVPLTKYIREKYGNKYRIGMTSNCTLIDKEKLEFMKKHGIGLLFSIDGDKKTQDKNRPLKNGKSSFDVLKDKIPLILEYYPNITFRSTTDHDNVEEFFNNHKFAVEQGFKNVFNIVNVFAEWSEEEKEELKHQIDLLGDYFFELYKEGQKVRFNPFCEMFPKLKRIYNASVKNNHRSHADNKLGFGRCGIGATKYASVGTDGQLYSCQEMVDNSKNRIFIIGNIYDGVDDEARMNIINQFNMHKVSCQNNTYNCSECKLDNICDGGCLINNYFVTGSLNIMPEILCFYYRTLLDKAEEINLRVAMLKR